MAPVPTPEAGTLKRLGVLRNAAGCSPNAEARTPGSPRPASRRCLIHLPLLSCMKPVIQAGWCSDHCWDTGLGAPSETPPSFSCSGDLFPSAPTFFLAH